MEFECRTFASLSLDELYEILALRVAVFVVEQDCPYQDLDGKDQEALHCIARQEGKIIAYSRLLPQGLHYDKYLAIGRVITSSEVRGQGVGRKIMRFALDQVQKLYPEQKIKISAQSHLNKFYESLGFQETGEEYLEDGIPHMAMIHQS